MTPFVRLARALPLLTLLIAAPALSAPTLVELTAEAMRPAVNDLLRATVFAEASGRAPGELAREVNALIAEALRTAKAYPGVTTRSGTTNTTPVYAKDGRIEAWRMHSQLVLEAKDRDALAELLGKLQAALGVASLLPMPSPETRKAAEDAALLDALGAFKARAQLIADALGKPYRIKQISLSSNSRVPQPLLRGGPRLMAADAAPMPIESGESQVVASVAGQIELLE